VLNDTQFETFRHEGYLHLGRLMSDAALEALQKRMDDLTSGKVVNEGLSFQSEPEAPGQVGMPGFAGPSGRYRKIGGLHHDSLIWDFITLPASSAIMRRLIEAPLAVHRAMVLLKPAGGGSALGWHQDTGHGFPAGPTRYFTIWTTLDAATADNGAMYVIPGTHHEGAFTGSWKEVLARSGREVQALEARKVLLPAAAGESYLIDPRMLHASGANHTSHRRRAMNVIYMPAGATIAGGGNGDYPLIAA
jgi:hypothetical protein